MTPLDAINEQLREATGCCASFSVSAVASLAVGVCATGMAPPGFRAGPLAFMVSAGCSVW